MKIDEMVTESLKKYHFELTEHGITSIASQVKLLYGIHPTRHQVDEVVTQKQISFINKMGREKCRINLKD